MGVIRWDRGADGIVVLTLDAPDQPTNTTGAAFRRSLAAAVERLERERATVTGVVVTSSKPTFATGADLRELVDLADPRAAYELATAGKEPLRRLETLGRPVVAAIGGAALGGGLEIALACHHRIALDAAGTQLGLPEATLGLMPSGGGVVRAVRLLGVLNALVNVLLQGQRYSAARARSVGLVDGLVATRAELLPAAKAWIRAHPTSAARWDAPGFQIPGGGPASPTLAAALASLPAGLRRQPAGATREAGPAILGAAVEGAQLDVDTALVVESRYFAELVTSQAARNLLGAFFVDMGRLAADGVDAGAGAAAAPGGRAPFEAPKEFVDRLLGAYLAEGVAMVGAGVPAPSVEQAGIQAGFRSSPLRLCDELTLAGARAAILAARAAGRTATLESRADLGDASAAPAAPPVPGAAAAAADGEDSVHGAGAPSGTDLAGGEGDVAGGGDVAAGGDAAGGGDAAAREDAAGGGDAVLAVLDRLVGEFGRSGRVGGAGFYDYAGGRRSGLWVGLREHFGASVGPDAAASPDATADPGTPAGQAAPAGPGTPAEAGSGVGAASCAGLPATGVGLVELRERLLFAVALRAVDALAEGAVGSVAAANVASLTGAGFPAWTGGTLRYVNGYPGGLGGFVVRAREFAARYGDRFAPPAALVERLERGESYA